MDAGPSHHAARRGGAQRYSGEPYSFATPKLIKLHHKPNLDRPRPHGRSNPRLQPRHRPRGRDCARSLRHDRQSPLYRNHRRRRVVRQQRGRRQYVSDLLYAAHRRRSRSRRSRRPLHQHWRAHRAAGRDRRDFGRHGRPQRCAGLVLRSRHPALYRRRQHLEPDPANDGPGGRPEQPGLQLCRRRFRGLCLEHGESAGRCGRGFRRL